VYLTARDIFFYITMTNTGKIQDKRQDFIIRPYYYYIVHLGLLESS